MAATGLATSSMVEVRQQMIRRLRSVLAIDETVLETLLTAFLARGHVLVEGIPGVGKTLLARTIARCVDCKFRRIQFTNDLMPSDVVGTTVWRPQQEKLEFVPGPLFANVVLADEINRTSPRTLSCLLEAMESGRVSVDDRDHLLGNPFLVIATRNGVEFHGTYPMPEAALDRFMVRIEIGYPGAGAELELYLGRDPEEHLASLQPVLTHDQLLATMREVPRVQVAEAVAAYCYRLVQATRQHPAIALGASPRAALAWLKVARARALLHGRSHVLPDDLQASMHAVLGHRLLTSADRQVAELLEEIRQQTPVAL